MEGKKSNNRWKNPWFYVGVIGVVLTAIGVDSTSLTSWAALWDGIKAWFSNPYLIGCAVMALLGAYVDPTTGGFKD